MAEYFCSWSGGADSTATALLALEHNEPLTALVYCEVMFDREVSGEVPEHAEFIHQIAIPWFEHHGIHVEVLRSQKHSVTIFTGQSPREKTRENSTGFHYPAKDGVQLSETASCLHCGNLSGNTRTLFGIWVLPMTRTNA